MERPTPETRRRAGRVMIGVGIVGVVVAVASIVVGWQFLGQVDASTGDSLDVTVKTLDSIDASITLIDEVLGATSAAIDTTGSTLEAVVSSFDESSGVIDSIQELTDTVGPSLDTAANNLRSLERVARGVDSLLSDISDIPFAPDYDPDLGLGPTVGQLADDLAVLPEEFATTSDELGGFAASLDELIVEIATLTSDIGEVRAELAGRDVLIGQYRENIAEARAVAVDTRDGLDSNIGLLRLLLVIGGINFGIGQIVPFWVGRNLLREQDADARTSQPIEGR